MFTLVLYEHPAARHMIDDWRETNNPPIKGWAGHSNEEPSNNMEIATMEAGEILFILPVIDGNEPPTLDGIVRQSGGFTKILYFGKRPRATLNSNWLTKLIEVQSQ